MEKVCEIHFHEINNKMVSALSDARVGASEVSPAVTDVPGAGRGVPGAVGSGCGALLWGCGCRGSAIECWCSPGRPSPAARPLVKFLLNNIEPQVAGCPVSKATEPDEKGRLYFNGCKNFDIFG